MTDTFRPSSNYKFYGFINNLGACPDSFWWEAVRVRQLRQTFLPLGLVFFPHDLQKVPHPQFQGQYYYIPEPFLKIGLS